MVYMWIIGGKHVDNMGFLFIMQRDIPNCGILFLCEKKNDIQSLMFVKHFTNGV